MSMTIIKESSTTNQIHTSFIDFNSAKIGPKLRHCPHNSKSVSMKLFWIREAIEYKYSETDREWKPIIIKLKDVLGLQFLSLIGKLPLLWSNKLNIVLNSIQFSILNRASNPLLEIPMLVRIQIGEYNGMHAY